MPSREDEPRRRRKEYDRERDSTATKAKDKDRPRSAKKLHRRRSDDSREPGRDSPRPDKSSTSDLQSSRSARKVTMLVPEMDRRTTATSEVKSRTSYPNFSKAHSREAVGSREDVVNPRLSLYTPEPTDLDQNARSKERRRASTPANTASAPPTRAPPSPPLTAEEPDIRRSGSGSSMRKAADSAQADLQSGRKSMENAPRTNGVKPSMSTSSIHKQPKADESVLSYATHTSRSTSTTMPGAFPGEGSGTDDGGARTSTPGSGYRRTVSTGSQPASTVTQTDSDATSIAPDQKSHRPPQLASNHGSSPPSFESSPRTPTPHEQSFPASVKGTPVIDVGGGTPQYSPQNFGMQSMGMPPPPPPPPPPMMAPTEVPRVDYLLKNGGLPYLVPKKLVGDRTQPTTYGQYASPRIQQGAPTEEYAKIFAPVKARLEDYNKILAKNGSLAVATGYTSIARRLLDRLEKVFMRNISSERCHCVICATSPQVQLSDEEDSGVSWGEILEFVSGRRELPQWPPFTFPSDDSGLGISGVTQAPMQKLDIDIPEQYREHYLRQNKKTRTAVHNWLQQQDIPSSPPAEVDDDTLMYAMMTHLTPDRREYFLAILHGKSSLEESTRAATPAERPASLKVLTKASMALQRLYRLPTTPRPPEATMYLVNNPDLHGMLATLAAVNEQEWDILVSGRFDGFLWSGAEAPFPPSASAYASPAASRGPSRGPTPLSRNVTPFSAGIPSRGTTPFSPLRNVMSPDNVPQMFPSRGPTPGPGGVAAPAPVQMDEETEIAVLAEVERAIFLDMEALEDQFEVLHKRAEEVRQLLRNRSAGLSMGAQMRRGSGASDVCVRLGTPASGFGGMFPESEDGDGLDDAASLYPDDSASNISYNRRHRPNRRHERRTPAPVEEEDESQFDRRDRRR